MIAYDPREDVLRGSASGEPMEGRPAPNPGNDTLKPANAGNGLIGAALATAPAGARAPPPLRQPDRTYATTRKVLHFWAHAPGTIP